MESNNEKYEIMEKKLAEETENSKRLKKRCIDYGQEILTYKIKMDTYMQKFKNSDEAHQSCLSKITILENKVEDLQARLKVQTAEADKYSIKSTELASLVEQYQSQRDIISIQLNTTMANFEDSA